MLTTLASLPCPPNTNWFPNSACLCSVQGKWLYPHSTKTLKLTTLLATTIIISMNSFNQRQAFVGLCNVYKYFQNNCFSKCQCSIPSIPEKLPVVESKEQFDRDWGCSDLVINRPTGSSTSYQYKEDNWSWFWKWGFFGVLMRFISLRKSWKHREFYF